MSREYPNTGAIFPRQKRNEKGPDFGGDITLEGDVLDHILRCAEQGDEVKIELSSWKRRTRDGGVMLSVKAEIPYEIRGGRSEPRRQEREPIQTSRGTYRSGRDTGGDYNPRHATQMGGSARDNPPRRGYEPQNRNTQQNFYDDMNDPLGDL